MTVQTVQLYVIEDHAAMRETLDDYFRVCPDIEVCGMASSAEEALEELDVLTPTVVLLDLSLPGRSGLDLLADIRDRWGTPCVVLSGHGGRGYVRRALDAGARGYVLKGSPGEARAAVRAAADGQVHLSGAVRSAQYDEWTASGNDDGPGADRPR